MTSLVLSLETLVENLSRGGNAWPDSVTVQRLLGRPWAAPERRAWLTLIERTYGRQVVLAAWAIFGRDAMLTDLARLFNHADLWCARVAEAPRLAPLLAPFVRTLPHPPESLKPLRDSLLRRGLPPAAWKWLARQHRDTVRKLLAFGWSNEAIFWVRTLSRACARSRLHPGWLEPGRPYLLGTHYLATQTHGDDAGHALQLERLLRMVPRVPEAQTMHEYGRICTGLLVALRDRRWPLTLHRNSTWRGTLERLRRHDDARMQAARESTTGNEGVQWTPRLGSLVCQGLEVRELTSSHHLVSEGIVLAHCVGDRAYAEACGQGRQVIVSLQMPRTGLRATLQLVREDHGARWRIGQLSGTANVRVPQLFWQVSRELQQRLSGTPGTVALRDTALRASLSAGTD